MPSIRSKITNGDDISGNRFYRSDSNRHWWWYRPWSFPCTQLAERGAKVVVNDLGGSRDGSGSSASVAQQVADEILATGGNAIANGADITQEDQAQAMVQAALDKWGRVDVLINNAGILRDKSFAKMSLDDWRSVVDVHLNGSAYCCHAVWPTMRQQGYGRIMMTSSSSGVYGNFGQANYGAAKYGVVGLMNVLAIEGRKYNIHVNSLVPTAATRMTEDVMTETMLEQLKPEYVTPAVLFLASADAPNGEILMAGAGNYTVAKLIEAEGIKLPEGQRTPENVAAIFDKISDVSNGIEIHDGMQHIERIVKKPVDPFG